MDRASLQVFLLTAKLIGRSEPFQAVSAFALLTTLDKTFDLPMASAMKSAIQASTAAQSSDDPRDAMSARYALIHLIMELESCVENDKSRPADKDRSP